MERIPTYLKMTLPALRVRLGLTQEEAAKRLGITRATLVNWEKDPSKVSYKYMKKMSELYCIPIDYIFFDNNIAFSDKARDEFKIAN